MHLASLLGYRVKVGSPGKFTEQWLCKPSVLCHSPTSLCNPIIPDKLLWSSTSANCSIKQEDCVQWNQHQQTSNTHTHLTMASSKLFQAIQVGPVALQHRVVMAPVTRYRGNARHTPTNLVVEHYAARASIPGTLLISEATYITHKASGDSFNVPGIWSDEQAAAWKKVSLLSRATLTSMCNSDHLPYGR